MDEVLRIQHQLGVGAAYA